MNMQSVLVLAVGNARPQRDLQIIWRLRKVGEQKGQKAGNGIMRTAKGKKGLRQA